MDMGYYGEEGRPLLPAEIEAEIEKAWSPVASNFDSEGSRHKRSKAYEKGALVGATAAGGYGVRQGVRAVREARGIKPREMAPTEETVDRKAYPRKNKTSGKITQVAAKTTKVAHLDRAESAVGTKGVRTVLGHGGKAAAGLAGAGALVGGSMAIKRSRKRSWQSYD